MSAHGDYAQIVVVPTPVGEDAGRPVRDSCATPRSTAHQHVHDAALFTPEQRSTAQFSRQTSVGAALANSARFMGISESPDMNEERVRWRSRRLQFLNHRYGCDNQRVQKEVNEINSEVATDSPVMRGFRHNAEFYSPTCQESSQTYSNIGFGDTPRLEAGDFARAPSTESRVTEPVEPAFKVIWRQCSSFIKRGNIGGKKRLRVPLRSRISFDLENEPEQPGKRAAATALLEDPVAAGEKIELDIGGGATTPDTSTELNMDHGFSMIPEGEEDLVTTTDPEDLSRPSDLSKSSLPWKQKRSFLKPQQATTETPDLVKKVVARSPSLLVGKEMFFDEPVPTPVVQAAEPKDAPTTSSEAVLGSSAALKLCDMVASSSVDVFDNFTYDDAVRWRRAHPHSFAIFSGQRSMFNVSHAKPGDVAVVGLDDNIPAPTPEDENDDYISEKSIPDARYFADGHVTLPALTRLGGEHDPISYEDSKIPDRPAAPSIQFPARPPLQRQDSFDGHLAYKKDFKEATAKVFNSIPDVSYRFYEMYTVSRDIEKDGKCLRISSIIPTVLPRHRGIGVCGRLWGQGFRKERVLELPLDQQQRLVEGEMQRQFFTWWVITVDVIVSLCAILMYGLGPSLFVKDGELLNMRVERKVDVEDASLVNRQIAFFVKINPYFGPDYSDLVRLGGKYSPCMRRETEIWKAIEADRRAENETACCVFNDNSGCYQTSRQSCPKALARWMKLPIEPTRPRLWSDSTHLVNGNNFTQPESFPIAEFLRGPSRKAGLVCGQDPGYCSVPLSVKPREWADDLTKWPICTEKRLDGKLPLHMTCELTGRPCCIQMQGLCRITSQEYCAAVDGVWHKEATLCSQVSCMSDVCGMLPFFSESPNQVYRLVTSLFLHAGIVHLAISVVIHFWLMRDLEKLIGSTRMALLYLGSGVAGNLGSAIFVPFNPAVGPSSALMGVCAALIVDIYDARYYLQRPIRALIIHWGVVLVLLGLGLLPMIDNWAALFGFFYGLLMTIVIFPYLDFHGEGGTLKEINERRKRMTQRKLVVAMALVLLMVTSVFLVYVFMANIPINNKALGFFNCIPFTDHFCDNAGLTLHKWLPI